VLPGGNVGIDAREKYAVAFKVQYAQQCVSIGSIGVAGSRGVCVHVVIQFIVECVNILQRQLRSLQTP
jgi:hypothetical protein